MNLLLFRKKRIMQFYDEKTELEEQRTQQEKTLTYVFANILLIYEN